MSLNNNRLAIGAIGVASNGLVNSGAVYIFERVNGLWVQSHKLVANNPAQNASFGTSVSLYNDNLLIGSPGINNNTGVAYVFNYNNSTQTWTQSETLVNNNAMVEDDFGFSVSLYAQRALVGVDTGLTNNNLGYATLFENLSNNQQTTFTANDANGANGFGYSVSLFNNKMIIGALFDTSISARSGSAYLFEYDTEELLWNQTQKFTAQGTTQTDNANFGNAVSVYGERVIIGSYRARPIISSGTVFLFEREGNVWNRSELIPTDGGSNDQYGFSVSLSDQWIAIGANLDDNGVQKPDAGSISLFFQDVIFSNSFEN